MDGWVGRQTTELMDGLVDGWMDGLADRIDESGEWMNKGTDRRMDEWVIDQVH